jgi:hypothetical protein
MNFTMLGLVCHKGPTYVQEHCYVTEQGDTDWKCDKLLGMGAVLGF